MPKVLKPRSTQEILAQRARARRRSSLRLWVIGGVIVLAVIAGFIFLRRAQTVQVDPGQSSTVTVDSKGEIVGLQKFSNLARDHQIGTLNYPQTPPVGGIHNPVWQNCGIYDQPVPNENAVHSLEHGAVWITYRPDLAAADVAKLRALVSGHRQALLSPYPKLPTPVVASAWGLQVQVQSAADPRLALFVSKYENGPQTQEPGATCSGGNGTPIAS